MKKKQNTYEPAFAEGQEPQPEKKPKRPRADAVFSATADTAPLPGTGTGAGSSRAGAPPRRKAYHGKLKAFLLLFSILMLAGLLGYCAMADNYKECFIPGTYINGIEATELTAEDIKARIKAEAEDYAITVTFRGTEPGSTVTEKIDAKDFGYHYISGKDVDDVFNAQDRYRWPLAYFGQNNNHTVGTDTDYEEEDLKAKREECAAKIDPRTMSAYDRIRASVHNHLAVVSVYNGDSCGGCFNTITPQRLVDIASNKKLIICEHCGRIIVNPDFE